MIVTKCTALTEAGKKSTFIVVDEDIIECTIKANNVKFSGTNLKKYKSLLSVEVIASSDSDNLIISNNLVQITREDILEAVALKSGTKKRAKEILKTMQNGTETKPS